MPVRRLTFLSFPVVTRQVKRVHGSLTPIRAPQLSLEAVGTMVHVTGKGSGRLVYYRPVNQAKVQTAMCGVVFDEAVGDTDGTLDGEQLFQCAPGHGMFTDVR